LYHFVCFIAYSIVRAAFVRIKLMMMMITICIVQDRHGGKFQLCQHGTTDDNNNIKRPFTLACAALAARCCAALVTTQEATARLEQSAGRDPSQPISGCLQTFTENSLLYSVFY